MAKNEEVIIVRRKKSAGHGGHHGGAWKVAYADFVTAMMCFFLVMWLMGSDKEIKNAIEMYFNPSAGKQKVTRTPTSVVPPLGENNGEGNTILSGAEGLVPDDLVQTPNRSPAEALSEYKDLKAKVQSELDTIAYGMQLNPDYIRFSIGESELFEPPSVTLKGGAGTVLDKVGKVLSRFPGYVTISAHVEDSPHAEIGGMSSPYEFTNARAVAVMNYLTQHRFMAEDRITPVGQGARSPLASNEQLRGQRRNRRVEFTLTRNRNL